MKNAVILLLLLGAAAAWVWLPRGPLPTLPTLDTLDAAATGRIRAAYRRVFDEPSAENWMHWARTLHAHDIVRDAEQAWLEAAGLDGTSRFECLYMAGVAIEETDPERAIEHLEAATDEWGGYMQAWLRLGSLCERLDRHDAARAHYTRANEMKETSHAHLGLGRLLMEQGEQPERAIGHLQSAIQLNPHHGEAHAALARALTRLGRRDAARRAAERAAQHDSATGFADEYLLAAVKLNPANSQRLAVLYMNAGRWDQALVEIDRFLGDSHDNIPVVMQKAVILGQLGRKDDAIKLYRRILDRDAEHIPALNMLAGTLIHAKRPREALPAIQRVLHLDPNNVRAHYNAAVIVQSGNPKLAITHLDAILRVEPGNVEARVLRALSFDKTGEKKRARDDLARARQLAPRHPMVKELSTRLN